MRLEGLGSRGAPVRPGNGPNALLLDVLVESKCGPVSGVDVTVADPDWDGSGA